MPAAKPSRSEFNKESLDTIAFECIRHPEWASEVDITRAHDNGNNIFHVLVKLGNSARDYCALMTRLFELALSTPATQAHLLTALQTKNADGMTPMHIAAGAAGHATVRDVILPAYLKAASKVGFDFKLLGPKETVLQCYLRSTGASHRTVLGLHPKYRLIPKMLDFQASRILSQFSNHDMEVLKACLASPATSLRLDKILLEHLRKIISGEIAYHDAEFSSEEIADFVVSLTILAIKDSTSGNNEEAQQWLRLRKQVLDAANFDREALNTLTEDGHSALFCLVNNNPFEQDSIRLLVDAGADPHHCGQNEHPGVMGAAASMHPRLPGQSAYEFAKRLIDEYSRSTEPEAGEAMERLQEILSIMDTFQPEAAAAAVPGAS